MGIVKYERQLRYRNRWGSNPHSFGDKGTRNRILARDMYKCMRCGLGRSSHKVKYGRDITVDHIDGDRKNNGFDNLQTLCLGCHGRKDGNKRLNGLRDIKGYFYDKSRGGWKIQIKGKYRGIRHSEVEAKILADRILRSNN